MPAAQKLFTRRGRPHRAQRENPRCLEGFGAPAHAEIHTRPKRSFSAGGWCSILVLCAPRVAMGRALSTSSRVSLTNDAHGLLERVPRHIDGALRHAEVSAESSEEVAFGRTARDLLQGRVVHGSAERRV